MNKKIDVDFNTKFPVSGGFPNTKVYKAEHWYGEHYEFEWYGDATAKVFKLFFKQLINYNKEQFFDSVHEFRSSSPEGKNKNYCKQYQIRFLIQQYNQAFLKGLNYFLEHIKSYINPTFVIFGEDHDQLIQLLCSLGISYKIFAQEDADIEKIEWYWIGMHSDMSPKIRFDKLMGHCVMLGSAIDTPIYPNYREAMFNWFSNYLNKHGEEATIEVEFLLDYFDMINNELNTWIKLLAKRFQPHQINFKWYLYYEDNEDINHETLNKLLKIFHPFSVICEILQWDSFEKLTNSKYQRFNDI